MTQWRAPIDVPDNTVRHETVLFGPHGEPLAERRPRPIGFRPPTDFGQQIAARDLPRDLDETIGRIERGDS